MIESGEKYQMLTFEKLETVNKNIKTKFIFLDAELKKIIDSKIADN